MTPCSPFTYPPGCQNPMRSTPRFVLFQAREHNDPMLAHEVDCFLRHLDLTLDELETFQVLERPETEGDALLSDPQLRALIGGSGDYSISTGGPPRLERFVRELIPQLVERQVPTFGSCWGLHALVKGLGGRVERRGVSEVGTFEVRLTPGVADPLLAELPARFMAQMGHHDWVVELPAGATPRCENDESPYQAVRFGDGPVYGLQFHAELTYDDNRRRYLHYIHHYGDPNNVDAGLSKFSRSSHANTLLRRFKALFSS